MKNVQVLVRYFNFCSLPFRDVIIRLIIGKDYHLPLLSKVCKATSPTTVFLSWTEVFGADWYFVSFYNFTENDGKGYIGKSPVYGTSCTVSGLYPNTNYDFTVTAQSENPNFRESYGSEIKEVTTPRD